MENIFSLIICIDDIVDVASAAPPLWTVYEMSETKFTVRHAFSAILLIVEMLGIAGEATVLRPVL